jgi:hypothetical protein
VDAVHEGVLFERESDAFIDVERCFPSVCSFFEWENFRNRRPMCGSVPKSNHSLKRHHPARQAHVQPVLNAPRWFETYRIARFSERTIPVVTVGACGAG